MTPADRLSALPNPGSARRSTVKCKSVCRVHTEEIEALELRVADARAQVEVLEEMLRTAYSRQSAAHKACQRRARFSFSTAEDVRILVSGLDDATLAHQLGRSHGSIRNRRRRLKIIVSRDIQRRQAG